MRKERRRESTFDTPSPVVSQWSLPHSLQAVGSCGVFGGQRNKSCSNCRSSEKKPATSAFSVLPPPCFGATRQSDSRQQGERTSAPSWRGN